MTRTRKRKRTMRVRRKLFSGFTNTKESGID
jgi:hypothetical protein